MANDEWDDPELAASDFVKFENPGDEIAGLIISKSIKTWDDGTKSPQLIIRKSDGVEKTVTAGQAQLKAKLIELKPGVGDRVKITHTRVEKRAMGKTLKHFDVLVAKAGETTKAKPSAPPVEDFAPEPVESEPPF